MKYTRLLKQSKSFMAKGILYTAENPEVLPVGDVYQDTGEAWCVAMSPTAASNLRKRVTQAYKPPAVPALNIQFPEVCAPCKVSLQFAFLREHEDEVHGVPGLPESVTTCPAVGIAAAFRRAAVWATGFECCDSCASIIGAWLDANAYKVIVALMLSERFTGERDWVLQNYIVGCVEIYPLCVPTILSGFDIAADIKYDFGAMGDREVVVDC